MTLASTAINGRHGPHVQRTQPPETRLGHRSASCPLEQLVEGRGLCFLDEADQQVLLERLAGHGRATPKGCVDVGGHVLDLDTGHLAILALFWRHNS